MCGDTCCGSCGPAQGNFHCPICGQWASEGCEHLDEETGDLKPEYHAQAEAIAAAERAAEVAMIEDWREDARLAEEFWASWKMAN